MKSHRFDRALLIAVVCSCLVLGAGRAAVLDAAAPAVKPAGPRQPPQPLGTPHVYKTVGGRELKAYVITPKDWKSSDRRPAIVFYNGGGWLDGSVGQFTLHIRYLITRGMVCVQAEYRALDRKLNEPPTVCVQDAKSAIRWVRSHAAELGVDPNRIASSGGSSGGHLAAFVGMVDGLDDPTDDRSVSARSNAMVLFNPVFDNGPGGYGHERVGDRYREFSPFHNVSPSAPPAIVFVGSEDPLLPAKTVLDFKAAMEKAGVRCDARVFPGRTHGFFNYGRGVGADYCKDFCETLTDADHFLASLGWLVGPPTLTRPPAPVRK